MASEVGSSGFRKMAALFTKRERRAEKGNEIPPGPELNVTQGKGKKRHSGRRREPQNIRQQLFLLSSSCEIRGSERNFFFVASPRVSLPAATSSGADAFQVISSPCVCLSCLCLVCVSCVCFVPIFLFSAHKRAYRHPSGFCGEKKECSRC